MFSRVPAYLEVEALLAGVLLFTAVSLTGFPPSVDVTKETVTLSDISVMYAPKSPHLRGPERLFIEAPQLTDLRSGEMGKKEDVIGGMIMLTHSHGVLERKEEFLIQSTHVSIGVLAVLMGCARWLEIRLPSPYNRLAGLLSLLATLLVGFILLFYMKPDPLVA